ncbi:MAG TPA: hypothetical protein VL651_01500 [Bacteroidia bacterium]|jgi:hypothetical protein|nr:hypothetical protein [Bacteroidia bacterium]
MTDQPTYRKLPDENCISEEVMYRYIDGKLAPDEMYAVEMHTLDCALCADALEGLSKVKDRDRKGAYWKLPEGAGGDGGRIISLWNRPALYYSAAACALLLIGFFSLRSFLSDEMNSSSPNMAEVTQNKNSDRLKDSEVALDSVMSYDSSGKPLSKSVADQPNINQSALAEHDVADSSRNDLANAQGPNRLEQNNTATGTEAPDVRANDVTNLATNTETNQDLRTQSDIGLDRNYHVNTITNSVTQQTVINKKDKTDSRAVTNSDDVPSTSVASGAVQPKAAAAQDTQTSDNVSTGNIADEQTYSNSEVTNAAATSVAEQVSSDTTSYHQVYHPNAETDADVDLSYASGVKMLDSNNAQASLVFFDDVIAHPSNSHYQDAEWKKAEALIKLGKTADAKTLLQKIVTEGGKYKTQAEDKLKTL